MSDGYTDSGDETREAPAPITAQERAAWQAAWDQAQRVAPGQWGMLVDPPNLPVLCYYPTDDVASRRIVPPHLWAYQVQVTAVNALPRLLAALTACEGQMGIADSVIRQLVAERDRAKQDRVEIAALWDRERDAARAVAAERDAARDEAAGLRDQLEMARAQIDVLQWGLDAAVRAETGATQPPLPTPSDPTQPALDRLAPLAAATGIPAPTLLRMAVDDLLTERPAPTVAEATAYVFAKNAALYRRLADPPVQLGLPTPPDPTQPEQLGLLP